MSLVAILLFIGTMALSLWATIRVRQVYNRFSLLPASSGLTGADTAATILRQEGIFDVEIVAHDQMLALAKVLSAAAWTYVAAFITSLVYFLLHVFPLLGGRRQ
jgi:Zn-dependent membrane protease YugP